ncbi:MAG: BrnT family toxin [Spirochaetales bacterium]|nr:BrnT family toxin [Spirochaetales bacterium]
MDDLLKDLLSQCTGFEWDKGNIDKNWIKHKVGIFESEQIFFNQPLLIQNDIVHSKKENRFFALGKTDLERMLFISFTVRSHNIRVISARDMSRKERKAYKQ